MTRKRRIDDPEQEKALLAWFNDYERVGTFKDKARELQVDEETLRDTIKRLRGETPRPVRRKVLDATYDQMASIPCKPCRLCGAEHSRRHSSGRPKRLCQTCSSERAKEYRPKYSQLTDEQKFKSNARSFANAYQRRGVLTRQPCSACGNPDAEKHHHDYSKPLEVTWLCRPCHMKQHGEDAA
jgi:hypothetical protein